MDRLETYANQKTVALKSYRIAKRNTFYIMNTTETKILESGIENLVNVTADTIEGSELHNKLYNEDYFVVGYYNAEQILNDYGTFDAIRKVQNYELDNFGECLTDLSDSEKVCNMLAYIEGEEFLSNCDTLQKNWDNVLTQKMINKIKTELQNQI